MVWFSKLLRLMPCFSKCNILYSEIAFFLNETCQCIRINFCQKSINFAIFLFTSPKYIVQKNAFLCKKLMIIHHKSVISIKNLCIDKKKYIVINHFDWSNCVFVCTVTYLSFLLPSSLLAFLSISLPFNFPFFHLLFSYQSSLSCYPIFWPSPFLPHQSLFFCFCPILIHNLSLFFLSIFLTFPKRPFLDSNWLLCSIESSIAKSD